MAVGLDDNFEDDGLKIDLSRSKTPALDRLVYLCPTRYVQMFYFCDKKTGRTIWLPEGYDA